jgi:hypothetical protein
MFKIISHTCLSFCTYFLFASSAACNYGYDATTEIFRYLFTLAVFSMLLVTLRVAWYDNVKVETFGNDNHLDDALEPNDGSSSSIEQSSDLIEDSPDDVQEQYL